MKNIFKLAVITLGFGLTAAATAQNNCTSICDRAELECVLNPYGKTCLMYTAVCSECQAG